MDVDLSAVRKMYGRRPAESHKGDFGNVLVVGGSMTYSGSPALVAMAALRAGADLTLIAAPERAADIAAGFSPDLITYPLGGDFLEERHLKVIMELLPEYDSIVIGNGLGLHPKTKRAVLKFLPALKIPCVVDADGVKMLKGKKLRPGFVLTPHAAEFCRLTGKVLRNGLRGKTEGVKKAAREMNCTILLKGHVDVISDGERVAYNRTGNPCMTKGGTGDTLAGICGALLARGGEPFEAACAAAFVNGRAGDIAVKDFGEGLLATDILDAIPKVIK